ncbi:MAG TPA: aminotransferase class I/II-fold pyridoxal phosphate-dependent enzyme [Calditrichia bacterium]|nr:aminotransferase class I/II-fold pyridoxal phosphate-dependent enzyme [Calditrichota bacterium]HQU71344.1 aminotransferase class I/II-fold pyridoxal phosphate-dependent enzyme [Calditrichia bacterium]HQV31473.1 aminotransferase class I/II-fold pyridoxal phosphate-dependent enzyme [Calditrichia bacterium]
MSLQKLDRALKAEVDQLVSEGRAKAPERIITGFIPPQGSRGPRYRLQGSDRDYIRMNANSYLSLSNDPRLIAAADKATHQFGVGPGAVRFIDGTFTHHVELEKRIAAFVGKPAAKIFNSAYTANLALALTIQNQQTHWIGDELNHNCIIRAMRISNVPRDHKAIYRHNNMEQLAEHLANIPEGIERVVVIFDGIFSMRGDFAPIDQIEKRVQPHRERFRDGIVTVVDDSHGIGAYGKNGRGTSEHTGTTPDVIVGTFGKAFGVNGGFIAGSEALIEAVRQKADTYIYTNPLSVADCAAALEGVNICDSEEGRERLAHLKARTEQFRRGVEALGMESIPGPHPVVPVLVRDTARTRQFVQYLFENGVLVVGLTFPVVPKGDETMRFQINAAHTESDIAAVLEIMGKFGK